MPSDLMKRYYAEDRERFSRIEHALLRIEILLKRIETKLGNHVPRENDDHD
jgi:hypothetical protein